MEKGTKVFKAYCSDYDNRFTDWIMDGVVTEIVKDGSPLVQYGDSLTPLDKGWRTSKADAKRDAHTALIRFIGKMQAKADKMADEILHETLTTEEVPHGVA